MAPTLAPPNSQVRYNGFEVLALVILMSVTVFVLPSVEYRGSDVNDAPLLILLGSWPDTRFVPVASCAV